MIWHIALRLKPALRYNWTSLLSGLEITGTDGGKADPLSWRTGQNVNKRPVSLALSHPRVMSRFSWQLWHVGMTPADLSDTKCVKATRGSCLTSERL